MIVVSSVGALISAATKCDFTRCGKKIAIRRFVNIERAAEEYIGKYPEELGKIVVVEPVFDLCNKIMGREMR